MGWVALSGLGVGGWEATQGVALGWLGLPRWGGGAGKWHLGTCISEWPAEGWGMVRRGLLGFLSGLFLALGAVGCATQRPAPAPLAPPKPILRIEEGTNGTVALQVAVRELVPLRRKDPVIRLVGVTHLGTKEYYAGLQELLDREPLVLFEGVGATNKEFLSTKEEGYSLQPALAKALGLRFQLQAINYAGSNFVNSDLTMSELARVMSGNAKEGGSGSGGTGGSEGGDAALGELMSVMDGSSWAGVFVKFGVAFIETSPKLRATVKLVLIETLGAMEGDLGDAQGLPPSMRRLMEVLIRERNSAVIRDTAKAVSRSRASRRDRLGSVAIFYGAGHLADLEKRLCAELGYRPGADEWRTAFDVNPRKSGMGSADVAMARKMVREQMRAMGMKKK